MAWKRTHTDDGGDEGSNTVLIFEQSLYKIDCINMYFVKF